MRRTLGDSEKLAWLRLARTPNVGPVTFQELLKRYGDAEAALDALPTLAKRGGRINPLKIPDSGAAKRELDRLTRAGGVMLASCEPDFPNALAALDPPPPVISVLGHPHLLRSECAAIVGSRNASAIGLRLARDFAQGLGQAGFSIVSGMARGIDSAAHQGSLETGSVAVLAGGLDHVYPRENEALYNELRERGAIITELPLGYRATARDFPRRNRLVSGLSLGVIVIEAAKRSGSLITARLAGEQGREVMATPGSPLDPRAAGANGLIRDGAALVQSADEAVEILRAVRRFTVEEPEHEFFGRPDRASLEAQADEARDLFWRLSRPRPCIVTSLRGKPACPRPPSSPPWSNWNWPAGCASSLAAGLRWIIQSRWTDRRQSYVSPRLHPPGERPRQYPHIVPCRKFSPFLRLRVRRVLRDRNCR